MWGLFWQLYYVSTILVVWYGFPHQNENLICYHYSGELTHQM